MLELNKQCLILYQNFNFILCYNKCSLFSTKHHGIESIKKMVIRVWKSYNRHTLESEISAQYIKGSSEWCDRTWADFGKKTSYVNSSIYCSGDIHVTAHETRFVLTMTHLSTNFSGDHFELFVLYKVTPVHHLLWWPLQVICTVKSHACPPSSLMTTSSHLYCAKSCLSTNFSGDHFKSFVL